MLILVTLITTILAGDQPKHTALAGDQPEDTAPRLTASVPAQGAIVAAGETDLVWTFDQPMMRDSYSVTGRFEDLPEFVGEPRFSADGRTFTIRMRLEPGRAYDLGVNSPSHKNFRAEDGAEAAFHRVQFSTSR